MTAGSAALPRKWKPQPASAKLVMMHDTRRGHLRLRIESAPFACIMHWTRDPKRNEGIENASLCFPLPQEGGPRGMAFSRWTDIPRRLRVDPLRTEGGEHLADVVGARKHSSGTRRYCFNPRRCSQSSPAPRSPCA